MDRIYYKVVKVRGYIERYWSITPVDICRLEYKIGHTTIPKINGSSLMVFDSLENALVFQHQIENLFMDYTILECNVTKPSKVGLFISPFMLKQKLENIAKLRYEKKKFRHLVNRRMNNVTIPYGTIFCESVTPISQIENS